MKKYKELPPLETITNVRSCLYKVGILLKEHQYVNNNFYASRITIANAGLNKFEIGTNGKGNSIEYSLASGYAEFMERIQNRMLFNNTYYATDAFLSTLPETSEYKKFLINNDLNLNYEFDRNEETWPVEKIIEHCSEDLLLLLELNSKDELMDYIKNQLGCNSCRMVPFYSISEQKEVLMPIEVLLTATGTNGMAAGNSFKEAFLQGMCEILERYAISEIYFNKIVPPTIPLEYFYGTPIFEKIQMLIEEKGYKITIKDCSLGKGLPVIGAIIVDPKNKLYNFKLGSDFVPERALERCFTEFHQSVQDFHGVELDLTIFDKKENLDDFEFHNYVKLISVGGGHWPRSIFSDSYSYEFEGFNGEYGNTDEDDIKHCIEIAKHMNRKIFIRDNSILGFPTYYIVIPGISQSNRYNSSHKLYKKSFENFRYLNNIDRITKEDAKKLADCINENYNAFKFHNFEYTSKYLYNHSSDLLKLDIELFAFMLNFYIENMEKAVEYMNLFLKDKDKDIFSYYFAISDYVNLKYCKNDPNVHSILCECYGEDIVSEVAQDLKDPHTIFQYYSFPRCFDCTKCKVKVTCSFIEMIKTVKRINDYEGQNSIVQLKMKDELNKILK